MNISVYKKECLSHIFNLLHKKMNHLKGSAFNLNCTFYAKFTLTKVLKNP